MASENTTLHSLVNRETKHEDSLAVVYDDGKQKRALHYSELWDFSDKMYACLKGHKVTAGEVIGVCVRTDEHLPSLLLGILRCGAAFYTFETGALEFTCTVLRDVSVRFLIVDRSYIQDLAREIALLDGYIQETFVLALRDYVFVSLKSVDEKLHDHNLAYCITTSGTTGQPKVVRVPHDCIVPNVTDLRERFSLTSSDLVLLSSPLTFDPSIVEIFMTLSVGGCLLIVSPAVKMMPSTLLEVIYHRNKVTVMQATPTLLMRFKEQQLSHTLLSASSVLRVLSLGGEKFPECSWIRKVRSPQNQTKFYNLYGTTEVSSWAMCYEVNEDDLRDDRVIPLGEPLRDTVVEVRDCSTGKHVIHSGTGLLYIGGTRRQCIVGEEREDECDLSKQVLRATGDIVRVGTDKHIHYVCRRDNQTKRHGKRIDLGEISQVAMRQDFVRSCAAILISSRLVLFVSLNDNNQSNDKTDDIHVYLRTSLPQHSLPDDVFVVANIPMTKHGKTDVEHLKSLYQTRTMTQSPVYSLDMVDTIWKKCLGVDQDPQLDCNFIAAGGSSIQAIHMYNDLENTFHIEMPNILDLILHKTFIDVKEYLNAMLNTKSIMNTAIKDVYKETETEEKNISVEKHTAIIKETELDLKDQNNTAIEDANTYTELKHGNLSKEKHTANVNEADVYENELDLKEVLNIKNAELDATDTALDSTKVIDNNDLEEVKVLVKNVEVRIIGDTDLNEVKDKSFTNMPKHELLEYTLPHGNKRKLEDENLYVSHDLRQAQTFVRTLSRGNRFHNIKQNLGSETKNAKYGMSAKCLELSKPEYCDNKQTDKSEINKTESADDNCISRKGKAFKLELEEMWKFDTRKCVDASPLIAVTRKGDSVVFIGSHSHLMCCISMATGECLWMTELPDRIESSACLTSCGKYVVVVCHNGYMYALHANTGDIWWQFDEGSEVKSSPVVDELTGHVIVGSHGQAVYCLDIQRQCVVWSQYLGCGSIVSTPGFWYEPHCVYVATLGARIFSLNAESGDVVWSYDCKKPLFSSVAMTISGVLVGCTGGQMYHLGHDGQLIWNFHTDGHIFSSPCVFKARGIAIETEEIMKNITVETQDIKNNTRVETKDIRNNGTSFLEQKSFSVFNNFNKSKFRVDTKDLIGYETSCFEKSSKFGINYFNKSELTRENKEHKHTNWHTVFGSHDCFFYCLNSNGDLIWKVKADSTVYATPFQGDITREVKTIGNKTNSNDFSVNDSKCLKIGVVVFASTKGSLYMVDSNNGALLCKYEMKGEVFSSPVLYDNTIVVGCRDDYVYCYKIITNLTHNGS